MLVTYIQCMTPVAAGNTIPVTLISYSFVCLGLSFSDDTQYRGDCFNGTTAISSFPHRPGSNQGTGYITVSSFFNFNFTVLKKLKLAIIA